MSHEISLQELLNHSIFKPILEDLIGLINRTIFIEDPQGNLLLGKPVTHPSIEEYMVTVNHENFGQVKGDSSAQVIARLLSYSLNQEAFVLFDDLTEIPNRRYFHRYFRQEWLRCQRENRSLCLLLCDLDYFKLYNDYYGHSIGDYCLKQVAYIMRETLKRPADGVFRFGGEEFAVILPNTTDEGGQAIGRELINCIEQAQIPHNLSPISSFVTISVGIASIVPQIDLLPQHLLQLADMALYHAKRSGRNRYAWLRSDEEIKAEEA